MFSFCSFVARLLSGDFVLTGVEVFPGIRFQRLAPSGDAGGVSCDADGPAIGPIRLLTKTDSGFAPRPVEELNKVFAFVVGHPVDCSNLVERLRSVTKAMNEGERAQAVFSTLFLDLPPLTREQAQRAAPAEKLLKASPEITRRFAAGSTIAPGNRL
jgi:hypothetical protein